MDWLFNRPDPGDILNPLSLLCLVLFGVTLVAAGIYNARPWLPPVGEPYTKGFVKRATMWLAWPAGLGIFFLINHFLQIDPLTFGRPIWQLLCLIALLMVAVILLRQAARDKASKAFHRTHHRRPRPQPTKKMR